MCCACDAWTAPGEFDQPKPSFKLMQAVVVSCHCTKIHGYGCCGGPDADSVAPAVFPSSHARGGHRLQGLVPAVCCAGVGPRRGGLGSQSTLFRAPSLMRHTIDALDNRGFANITGGPHGGFQMVLGRPPTLRAVGRFSAVVDWFSNRVRVDDAHSAVPSCCCLVDLGCMTEGGVLMHMF